MTRCRLAGGLSADYTDFRRFLFQALILHDAMRGGVVDDDQPEIQSVVICGHLRNLWMTDNTMSFYRACPQIFADFRRFLFRLSCCMMLYALYGSSITGLKSNRW